MAKLSKDEKLRLREAEAALLSWGIEWSDDWYELDSPSCHFQASDVQVKHGVVHQVRYFKGAPGQSLPESGPALLYIHGYGGGCAELCSVLPKVRESWAGAVFSVDLFGCGLSSDPKWKHGSGKKVDPLEAEKFFLEPLKEWCEAANVQRIVLAGQSFGGYLCVSFALLHPELVDRLVLCSPAGLDYEDDATPSGGFTGRVEKLFWNSGIYGALLGCACCRCLRKPLYSFFLRKAAHGHSWVEPSLLAEYFNLVHTNGRSSGLDAISAILSQNFHSRISPEERWGSIAANISITFIFGGDSDPNMEIFPETEEFLQRIGRPYEVLTIAEGGHNMMLGNAVGLAEAIQAAASGQQADGDIFGEEALVEDSRSMC